MQNAKVQLIPGRAPHGKTREYFGRTLILNSVWLIFFLLCLTIDNDDEEDQLRDEKIYVKN